MWQTFSTATCYLPYLLLLTVTVATLPAIALFPRLITQPALAVAIPIISILIVNGIALVLFFLGIYNHAVVTAIILIINSIAIFRLFLLNKNSSFDWSKPQLYLLLINFCLLIPMIAQGGISVFSSNDALASWNFWAAHFYMGELPKTGGYPPFFPIFLSFCYKLLNNLEYQGPVKALLFIFPFTCLNAIAFCSSKATKVLPLYLLTAIVCVSPGFLKLGLYKFYTIGYADPMLAATVVCTVMLFIKYFENRSQIYLWTGALCGIVASLSKQPAFFLILFSLPALFILDFIRHKRFVKHECIAMAVMVLPLLIWLIGPGSQFYNNQGVLDATFQHSSLSIFTVIKTFLNSFKTYFVYQPTLLLAFILAGIAAWKDYYKMRLFFLFLVPATLLWFIFGSYHIRLGLYLTNCYGLFIASHDFFATELEKHWLKLKRINQYFYSNIHKIAYGLLIITLIIFVIFSIRIQKNKHHDKNDPIYPLKAGLTNIITYYDKGADFVYQNIYDNKDIQVLIPDNYIAGIFYGHTPIIPIPKKANTTTIALTYIKMYQPDYIFTSGRIPNAYSQAIETVTTKCSKLFTEVPLGSPWFGYRIFKLNKNRLSTYNCNL